MPMPKVIAVAVPGESAISRAYASTHLADAFRVALPPGASNDPERLARFVFSTQPAWVNTLMRLRDALVGRLGLKTGAQLETLGVTDRAGRVGIFRIYGKDASEIVLGEDDAHLDFRVSVRCEAEPGGGTGRCLTVSTVVHCHNLLGRVYIFCIAPFHRLVVRSSLRRAARVGWPPASVS